jgi:hypothetical protein
MPEEYAPMSQTDPPFEALAGIITNLQQWLVALQMIYKTS